MAAQVQYDLKPLGLRYEGRSLFRLRTILYGRVYRGALWRSRVRTIFSSRCCTATQVFQVGRSLPGLRPPTPSLHRAARRTTEGSWYHKVGLNYSRVYIRAACYACWAIRDNQYCAEDSQVDSVFARVPMFFQGVTGANPGGTITANRNLNLGNMTAGHTSADGTVRPPQLVPAQVFRWLLSRPLRLIPKRTDHRLDKRFEP